MLLNLVVPHPEVLSLGEIEIIFPSAACTVLCFAVAPAKVLVGPQGFGYCQAELPQPWQCFSTFYPHQGPGSGSQPG